MLKVTLIAASLTLSLAAVPTMVSAEETQGFDIRGAWTGKGFVQKDSESRKMNVTCKIQGAQEGDELGFDGECRAMMVLKRAIGADIMRQGTQYTGTYVGSKAGPAVLNGGPKDDGSIVLQMTFPKTIHGDDIATMTIQPENERVFKITTVDLMGEGQTPVTTAQITFERD